LELSVLFDYASFIGLGVHLLQIPIYLHTGKDGKTI